MRREEFIKLFDTYNVWEELEGLECVPGNSNLMLTDREEAMAMVSGKEGFLKVLGLWFLGRAGASRLRVLNYESLVE